MKELAAILVAGWLALVTAVPAYAQEEFSLHFDAAHIVGTGELILVHRVPVVNSATGDITLYNVTIDVSVAPDGSFVVDQITSIPSASLQHSADNFIPGTYEDRAGNSYIVSVGGVTAAGRSVGSIRSDSEGVTFNANWMSGPALGHPLIGSLEIAAELLEGPNYGVVGENNFNGFCTGRLIGVEQTGTSIVLTAYHTAEWSGGSCSTAANGNPNTSFGQATVTLTLVSDSLVPPAP